MHCGVTVKVAVHACYAILSLFAAYAKLAPQGRIDLDRPTHTDIFLHQTVEKRQPSACAKEVTCISCQSPGRAGLSTPETCSVVSITPE